MAYEFFLGVDAVETDDGAPEAVITLVEKEADGDNDPSTFRVHLIEQATGDDLGARVAERIQDALTQKPFIGRTVLVVNRTMAPGQDVLKQLDERGLDAIAAELTGGSTSVAGDTSEMAVEISAQEMVDHLATVYHDQRLDVSPQKDREIVSRLLRTVERFGSEGADSDGQVLRDQMGTTPAEGAYDPVVVSAALACWTGAQQSFDPISGLKQRPEGVGNTRR